MSHRTVYLSDLCPDTTKSGKYCTYYPNHSQPFAYKFYQQASAALDAYRGQRLCHYFGLAPSTGSLLTLLDENGLPLKYGYETERVDFVVGTWLEDNCERFSDIWYSIKNTYFREAFQYICYDLELLGYGGDNHMWNFGYLRGKLVLIDFDSYASGSPLPNFMPPEILQESFPPHELHPVPPV